MSHKAVPYLASESLQQKILLWCFGVVGGSAVCRGASPHPLVHRLAPHRGIHRPETGGERGDRDLGQYGKGCYGAAVRLTYITRSIISIKILH